MNNTLLLIPLDDRPCCCRFPLRLAELAGFKAELPPAEFWSGEDKRQSDAVNKHSAELAGWLAGKVIAERPCAAVVCLDCVCYGGLVASRSPGDCAEALEAWHRLSFAWDTALKQAEFADNEADVPQLMVFLSVMRAAPFQRSAAEVEAAVKLTEFSCRLASRIADGDGSAADMSANGEEGIVPWEKAVNIADCIRSGINPDFLRRCLEYRRRKHILNRTVLAEWSRKRGDTKRPGLLALGMDDSRTLGLNVLEAGQLRRLAAERGDAGAFVGAGTDETACLLMAGAAAGKQIIGAVWSEEASRRIVTLYEGAALEEVLRGQALWCNADVLELAAEEAEKRANLTQLWIYAPHIKQNEAAVQKGLPGSCDSGDMEEAALDLWLDNLERSAQNGARVFLADLAYANGGSLLLAEKISRRGLWSSLCGFSAWNTAGNALGTALAWAVFCSARPWNGNEEWLSRRFMLERVLDDCFYQSQVRGELSGRLGGNFVISGQGTAEELSAEISCRLQSRFEAIMAADSSFDPEVFPWRKVSVRLPWRRLFEIEISLEK